MTRARPLGIHRLLRRLCQGHRQLEQMGLAQIAWSGEVWRRVDPPTELEGLL